MWREMTAGAADAERRGRTPSPGVTPQGAVFVAVFLFCCVYVSHVKVKH